MGILDDAIKEHLELKRQHGADDSELKQLEDEAFGAAERPGNEGSPPDPLAEAPTEFMTQPGLEPEAGAEVAPEAAAPDAEEAPGRRSGRSEIADLQEPPPSQPEESASEPEAPSEEELVEEEMDEPRLAPVDPLAGLDDNVAEESVEKDEEDDDFWDDKRLSDELDQALEAPSEVDEEEPAFEPKPEEQPLARPDEDVLEETPDFLEEAPEDDQLWFEQKPPKDFDFDD